MRLRLRLPACLLSTLQLAPLAVHILRPLTLNCQEPRLAIAAGLDTTIR
jgi:hypothetical protein